MTFPINDFYSATYKNISSNGAASTSIFDTSAIPSSGYAMILSIIASNKSTTTRGLNVTLQKSGSADSVYMLYDVALPSRTAFEIIQGNKFILKNGDSLKAFADADGADFIDVIVSYVIYTPGS
jgi:hypothetical protein